MYTVNLSCIRFSTNIFSHFYISISNTFHFLVSFSIKTNLWTMKIPENINTFQKLCMQFISQVSCSIIQNGHSLFSTNLKMWAIIHIKYFFSWLHIEERKHSLYMTEEVCICFLLFGTTFFLKVLKKRRNWIRTSCNFCTITLTHFLPKIL